MIYDMAPLANGSSAIQLQVLKIDGMIRFLDSSEIPEVALSADIILVTGKLQIGSADKHFRCSSRHKKKHDLNKT